MLKKLFASFLAMMLYFFLLVHVYSANDLHTQAIPTIDHFYQSADAPVGSMKLAVIFLEYSDVPPSAGNNAAFLNTFLADLTVDTSLKSYYYKNSSGHLNIDMKMTSGWLVSAHTEYFYGVSGAETGVYKLAQDAINLGDAQIDYSVYQNVLIVHTGDNHDNSGDSADLGSTFSVITMPTNDGVIKFRFAVVAEPNTNRANGDGMGMSAHQVGHLLGLPDLDDQDGGSNGIGQWGLMGSGKDLSSGGARGNNPANLCAWSKYYLGWLDFLEVRDTKNSIQHLIINSAESTTVSPRAFLVPANSLEADFNRQEYFLIEYRENDPAISTFDRGLPGRGLLIWHIDDGKLRDNSILNTVNTDENRKGVDLEAADGNRDMDKQTNSGDAGDPFFPGIKEDFSYQTDPSSHTNDGNNSRVRIFNVAFGPGFAQMQFDLSASFVTSEEDVINYPNPFRVGFDPYTTIEPSFGTSFLTHKFVNGDPISNDFTAGSLQVDIFDRAGRPVRHLVGLPFVSDFDGDGVVEARWDGQNDRGRLVEPGIYFYAVKHDGGRTMNRMTVIKW